MKKKIVTIMLSGLFILLMSGCEKNVDDTQNSVEVNISDCQIYSEEIEEEKSQVEEESSIDMKLQTEDEEGKTFQSSRTALADTGVKAQDLINLPEEVAPEFTYYIYNSGTDGMLKAQQYLEQIGVSQENEKLVVLWYQDNNASPILIDEYTFDEDTIYCVSHSFYSSESNYQNELSNYATELIDYTDADAYYIRTVASQETINILRSYDTLLESLNNEYRVIVW